ncbi:MAG: hypothetical protein ACRYGI_03215, partial [Janthinobacterium lividum]
HAIHPHTSTAALSSILRWQATRPKTAYGGGDTQKRTISDVDAPKIAHKSFDAICNDWTNDMADQTGDALPSFQCTGCGAIVARRAPHPDPEKQRRLVEPPFNSFCDHCHPLLWHIDD